MKSSHPLVDHEINSMGGDQLFFFNEMEQNRKYQSAPHDVVRVGFVSGHFGLYYIYLCSLYCDGKEFLSTGHFQKFCKMLRRLHALSMPMFIKLFGFSLVTSLITKSWISNSLNPVILDFCTCSAPWSSTYRNHVLKDLTGEGEWPETTGNYWEHLNATWVTIPLQ